MREVVLILHNIRSLHNVGSIFRTADGAGVKKIYLICITPQPTDRLGRVREPLRKVSLGAEETVSWEKVSSFARLSKKMREEGYSICALEQAENSINYTKLLKTKKKIALVVGNEVDGVPRAVTKNCDYILEIPMRGKKESLNVSVATGIALFRITNP
ncbi:MAG: TrmH family RNA methyltransferase [Patescibacteria group bacterium]